MKINFFAPFSPVRVCLYQSNCGIKVVGVLLYVYLCMHTHKHTLHVHMHASVTYIHMCCVCVCVSQKPGAGSVLAGSCGTVSPILATTMIMIEQVIMYEYIHVNIYVFMYVYIIITINQPYSMLVRIGRFERIQ